jgi:hypothetical protein
MSFTPIGLLLIITTPVILIRFKNSTSQIIDFLIILAFLTSIAVEAGYVIMLGGYAMGYGTFFMLLTCALFYLTLFKDKSLPDFIQNNKKLIILFSIFYVYIVTTLLISKFFIIESPLQLIPFPKLDEMYQLPGTKIITYDKWNVKAIIMFPVWFLYALILPKKFAEKAFSKQVLYGIYISVIVIFTVQIIAIWVNSTGIFENGFRDIVAYLFGKTRGMRIQPLYRYNFQNVYAFFKEPSHLAILYFILYTSILFSKDKKWLQYLFVLISIPSIIVSGGTTPFVLMSVFLPLLYIKLFLNSTKKQKIIISTATVIMILAASPILYQVFMEAFTKFTTYTGIKTYSPNERMQQIFVGTKVFLMHPLIGTGVNSIKNGVLLATLLPSLGLIGTVLYFYNLSHLYKQKWHPSSILYCLWTVFFWLLFLSIPFGAIYAPYFPFLFLFCRTSEID